jgi:hypothetical protein
MDLDGTLQACQALHRNLAGLIKEETDFVRKHQIRLIVGDIPPICFEIAAQAAIDSIGLEILPGVGSTALISETTLALYRSLKRWKISIATQRWL